eukprot:jgi/Botrbrau1/14089/Bobra.182_3s0035.1
MAHSFSFPVLGDAELLPCLREMDVPISAAQLAKPTYEVVRSVFEAVVTLLMGVTREELQQPVFAAIDVLDFPELHDESIPFMAFMSNLMRLMGAAGVRDFTMQDVCKPDPARLRKHLSAIVNFTKFREEKLIPYAEAQERMEAELDISEQLTKRQQQLEEELVRLQSQRAAEMPEVKRLEAEAEDLHKENRQLNRQQEKLDAEVQVLKAQTNVLRDKAATLKIALQHARKEGDGLRAAIVESPEKLRQVVEETASAVEKERAALTDGERVARDLQARLDAISRAEREVVKVKKMLDELKGEVARKKTVSREVKDLRATIAANEAEAAQLAAQQQHLKRQIASLQERLQRLEAQAALKKEAAQFSVEEQLKEREAVEAENAANLARVAENAAAMRALRDRILELKDAYEGHIEAILDKYASLRRQVTRYHNALETAMAQSGSESK